MGVAGLITERWKKVERPREPTPAEVLRGTATVELSQAQKAGLTAQGNMLRRQIDEAWAVHEAEQKAKAAAEARRDEAILARHF